MSSNRLVDVRGAGSEPERNAAEKKEVKETAAKQGPRLAATAAETTSQGKAWVLPALALGRARAPAAPAKPAPSRVLLPAGSRFPSVERTSPSGRNSEEQRASSPEAFGVLSSSTSPESVVRRGGVVERASPV